MPPGAKDAQPREGARRPLPPPPETTMTIRTPAADSEARARATARRLDYNQLTAALRLAAKQAQDGTDPMYRERAALLARIYREELDAR